MEKKETKNKLIDGWVDKQTDGFKELQGGNRGGNLQRNGKFHSDLERKREERRKGKEEEG